LLLKKSDEDGEPARDDGEARRFPRWRSQSTRRRVPSRKRRPNQAFQRTGAPWLATHNCATLRSWRSTRVTKPASQEVPPTPRVSRRWSLPLERRPLNAGSFGCAPSVVENGFRQRSHRCAMKRGLPLFAASNEGGAAASSPQMSWRLWFVGARARCALRLLSTKSGHRRDAVALDSPRHKNACAAGEHFESLAPAENATLRRSRRAGRRLRRSRKRALCPGRE
jgi:hypothetical protein